MKKKALLMLKRTKPWLSPVEVEVNKGHLFKILR